MRPIRTVQDLWEVIAYVLAYAPDQFPYRSYNPPDQQMNLDRAFEQLRAGVLAAYPEAEFETKRQGLNAILDSSYAAYKNGADVAAGHLLNEFQSNIFKTEQ